MKMRFLLFIILFLPLLAAAQTAGQWVIQKKNAGSGYTSMAATPTVGQFLKVDGSGNMAFAAGSGGGSLLDALNVSSDANAFTGSVNLGGSLNILNYGLEVYHDGSSYAVIDSADSGNGTIRMVNKVIVDNYGAPALTLDGINGTLLLSNGSLLGVGTFDNELGGAGGISLTCSVGVELNWQAGHLGAWAVNTPGTYVPIVLDSGLYFPASSRIYSSLENGVSIDPSDRSLVGHDSTVVMDWSGMGYNAAAAFSLDAINDYDGSVQIGYAATGADYGTAVGLLADAHDVGAAFGYGAQGNGSGAAVGVDSLANQHGTAVGNSAWAPNFGVAIGFNASVDIGQSNSYNSGNVAIGSSDDFVNPATIASGLTDTVILGRGQATSKGLWYGNNGTAYKIISASGALQYGNGTDLTTVGGILNYASGYQLADSYGSLYYNNGPNLTDSSGSLYYGNGNNLADSSGNLYYNNGYQLADSSGSLYYSNGNNLADSSGALYYSNGNYLADSSSLYFSNGVQFADQYGGVYGTWYGTAIGDGYIASALTGKTYNGMTITSNSGTLHVGDAKSVDFPHSVTWDGVDGKTFTASNTLTLAGTDGSTLNVGTGGTLGTAAYTAASAYQAVNTKLTSIAALANGAGWLHNDGAGVFAYTTPSATDVGLGSVTNNAQTQAAIVPNTAPSAGQVLIGNAGGTAYAKNTLSGSGATFSLSSAGVLTVSAIADASISSAATWNAKQSALVAGTDYQVPLTFSTGLTKTTNTVTVNTSQNISTLSNLTSNGLVKTSGDTGALSIATAGTDYAGISSTNAFTRLQTITQGTANEGVLASTGYSLTGSNASNMIDLAGTWNTSGNPTAIKVNVTNTASGATSNLMDLQIGGTSKFKVSSTGVLAVPIGSAAAPSLTFSSFGWYENSALGIICSYASTPVFLAAYDGMAVASNGFIGFSNSTSAATSRDTVMQRESAAVVQHGVDSATPIAQTIKAPDARAGTDTNVAGTSLTLAAGRGTGTAAVTSSTVILQSPVAVASGTGAQTLTTGLTIINGTAKLTSYTVSGLPSASTCGAGACAFVTDATATTAYTTVAGGGANKVLVISDGTNWVIH